MIDRERESKKVRRTKATAAAANKEGRWMVTWLLVTSYQEQHQHEIEVLPATD